VAATERVVVRGIPLDVLRRGAGRPILLLHGEAPLDPGAPRRPHAEATKGLRLFAKEVLPRLREL
jgi:hypothetical protein